METASEHQTDAPEATSPYDRYVSTKIGAVMLADVEDDYRHFMALFSHYLRGWLPEPRSTAILDAGCGHGSMLYVLGQWGYTDVHGIDISEEQSAIASKSFPNAVCGDVFGYLEENEGHFGLITALDLIEHFDLDGASRFLNLCRRALVPGGHLILQTPNGAGLRGNVLLWGDVTHQRVYAPSAMEQLLLLHGFDAVQFRELGPVCHGPVSACRWLAWRGLRSIIRLIDFIEVGRTPSIHTRNMLVRAQKSELQ